MSRIIDERYFQELAALDPGTVCARAGCSWDPRAGRYCLRVWELNYTLSPAARTIDPVQAGQPRPHDYLALFMIHYLLSAQAVDIQGVWISEKEIPSGAAFFRGPHTIPTQDITRRFGNDCPAFSRRCEQLEGTPLAMADAAYRFQITPRIPVAALYFEGDQDFPPESKLLFDSSISQHLAPDVLFALAVAVCDRLAA